MTTQDKSSSFLSSETRQFAMSYFEGLGTPISLGLYLLLKYGDDFEACSFSIDPRMYEDVEIFSRDYLAAMLLSKFRDAPQSLESSRKAESMKKFWSCEEYLKGKLPLLLRTLYGHETKDHTLQSILYSAREKIARILGPVRSSFKVDLCEFGPGSSSSIPRRKAHPSQKYIARDVTAGCAHLRDDFLSVYGLGLDWGLPNLIEYSRVTVVPKSFKADRIIAIEPDWNIFFQKGFGRAIRNRLRLHGIDLNHGGEYHSRLAKEGSLSSSTATLDLSSASDSISTELVRFLLPFDWYCCLNSIRTDRIKTDDGVIVPVTKFSSMGNGFTFELESLIFYGLTLATVEHCEADGPISVFGDDIVAPTAAVPLLLQVFDLAGFRINPEKSYWTSYFRESCGGHFFKGRDVKPFYLKENINHDSVRFKVCNSIRRASSRIFGCDFCNSPLLPSHSYCARHIRRVFYIPEGYGDGGLISSFDEVHPARWRSKDRDVCRLSSGFEGFRVRCLQPVVRRARDEGMGLLLHKIRGTGLSTCFGSDGWKIPSDQRLLMVSHKLALSILVPEIEPSGNEYPVTQSKTSYRVGFMKVPQWEDPK